MSDNSKLTFTSSDSGCSTPFYVPDESLCTYIVNNPTQNMSHLYDDVVWKNNTCQTSTGSAVCAANIPSCVSTGTVNEALRCFSDRYTSPL